MSSLHNSNGISLFEFTLGYLSRLFNLGVSKPWMNLRP